MNEALQNLLRPQDGTKRAVVAVVAAFLDSGYIPSITRDRLPILNLTPSGSVSLDILPSDFLSASSDVYQLNLLPGPVNVKIIPLGSKLAIHATAGDDLTSLTIESNLHPADVSVRVTAGLIAHLRRPLPETQGINRIPEAQPIFRRPRLDRPDPDDPLRLLPGHTPEGGDLVGPHHPLFGDPRYDPIGPGNIGEPNFDHQPPGPFGQRPSRRPNFPFQ